MRVTLVNVRTMTRNVPPHGMLSIAAVLEQEGISVSVIDPKPRMERDFNYIKEILKTLPDVVGFTLLSNQVKRAIPIIQRLKRLNPELPIVAGGPHATFMPDELLDNSVDVVIMGEGEITVKELIPMLGSKQDLSEINGIAFKKNGKTYRTKPREFIKNLDELPLPARHLVDMDFYSKRSINIRGLYLKTGTIMTSRGCPGECIFCASPNMWKRVVRYRDPKRVVDEMELLYYKYKLDGFNLLDDTFTLNQKHVMGICDEIRRRKLDIIWNCQGRVNTSTEDVLRKIVKAGCVQIEYGVESGSQRILDLAKKQITVKQIEDAFRLGKKFKIRSGANFVIGFPTETKEDIELTRKLAMKIKADLYDFFILVPYPGTEIQNIAIKNGYVPDYRVAWEHGHRGKALAYWESNFTREEILAIRDNLQREFRSKFTWSYALNPYVIKDVLQATLRKGFYKNLAKIRSSEDFVYFIVDQISQ